MKKVIPRVKKSIFYFVLHALLRKLDFLRVFFDCSGKEILSFIEILHAFCIKQTISRVISSFSDFYDTGFSIFFIKSCAFILIVSFLPTHLVAK